MPAYVPPHMRKASQSDNVENQPLLYDKADIREFLKVHSEDVHTLTCTVSNDSIPKSQLLGIVLYHEQHPDWQSSRQVLCKSNLEVLHEIACGSPSFEPNVVQSSNDCQTSGVYPVFEELGREKGLKGKKFAFAGWFRIANIDFLEGNDPRLVEMFSRKFSHDGTEKERSAEAWKESFSHQWAIVTLDKDESRLDRPPKHTLNVNDMLRTSRDQAAARAPQSIPSTA